MKQQLTLAAGAIFGFLGVALGAFGAHALKPFLVRENRLDTFELAVRYMFYHALALLALGLLMNLKPAEPFRHGSICFVTGILFFSGSLFMLCFTGLGVLGMITPVGGVLLILGWSFLFLGVVRK